MTDIDETLLNSKKKNMCPTKHNSGHAAVLSPVLGAFVS